MLAQDLRINRGRADAKPASQVKSKPQAVEIRPGAQNARVTEHSHRVGQRIGRIRDDECRRLRFRRMQPTDNVLEDIDIGIEQPQSAGGIIAVGGAAGLFVNASGDHHQRGALQIGVIAVPHLGGGRQHGAVLDVGYQPPRFLPIAVQDHDFAGNPSHQDGC